VAPPSLSLSEKIGVGTGTDEEKLHLARLIDQQPVRRNVTLSRPGVATLEWMITVSLFK